MRAASRLKGTAGPATLKEGGSTRAKPLALRRERMPERLPRVGERPAGAESGARGTEEVLSLEMGDLGFRVARGRGRGVLEADLGAGAAALVRKSEGL